MTNHPFSNLEGYFYAFNIHFMGFHTLANTRETFSTTSATFRIRWLTSFIHQETFFNGRKRLLTPPDTLRIARMWFFTYPEVSFTCRDRLVTCPDVLETSSETSATPPDF